MRTLRCLRLLPAALALAAAAACTPLPEYQAQKPVPAPAPIPDRLEAIPRGERVLVDHATGGGRVRRLAGTVVQADALGITVRTDRETRLVELWKGFEGRRPQTIVRLTADGRRRFLAYLQELERVVRDALPKAERAPTRPRALPAGWQAT